MKLVSMVLFVAAISEGIWWLLILSLVLYALSGNAGWAVIAGTHVGGREDADSQ